MQQKYLIFARMEENLAHKIGFTKWTIYTKFQTPM